MNANHSAATMPLAKLDDENTRRGLRAGLRRWRNGLAVAPVIR